jgi:hypothetical protein
VSNRVEILSLTPRLPLSLGIGPRIAVPQDVFGLITEHDLGQAESVFPGIERLYEELEAKPRTFLQLVWEYTSRHPALAACSSPSEKRQFADGFPGKAATKVAVVRRLAKR